MSDRWFHFTFLLSLGWLELGRSIMYSVNSDQYGQRGPEGRVWPTPTTPCPPTRGWTSQGRPTRASGNTEYCPPQGPSAMAEITNKNEKMRAPWPGIQFKLSVVVEGGAYRQSSCVIELEASVERQWRHKCFPFDDFPLHDTDLVCHKVGHVAIMRVVLKQRHMSYMDTMHGHKVI